jgi:hypothetical protein
MKDFQVAQRGLPKLWQARGRLVELFDSERVESAGGELPEN